MPIYAYKCGSCGFGQDEMQKVSDAPLTACPSCGGGGYAKQLTAAGFHLKGSGWYASDFKGGAKPAENKEPAETKEAAPSHACGTGACPACH